MNNRLKIKAIPPVMLLCLPAISTADSIQNWQLERLNSPTTQQLSSEKDRVFIYDGLYSHQIESALDKQFDRMENMMFVRVKVLQDGVEQILEDDCGD